MTRLFWIGGVLFALCWGLLLQAGCGGDTTVFIPGCESCPERCLILKEGASGRCVQCLSNTQCRDNKDSSKICSKDNRCICGNDKDCPKGQFCVGNRGCVECKSNKDCTSADKSVCIASRCEACEPNSQRACAPDGATVCKKGTQTCKATNTWGECKDVLVCKPGEKCEKETCVPDCSNDPCKAGERTCDSAAGVVPGKFKVCIKNAKGCYEWKAVETCGPKEVCSKGQCTPYNCPPAKCVEKDTRCDGDGGFQTCVKTPLGCLEWSKTTPCKSTEKCQKGLQRCALCNPKDARDCYDGPKGTKDVGVCKAGQQTCKDDGSGFGDCKGAIKPGKEICNNKDDNCDGKVDESLIKTCYTGANGTKGVGLCKEGTSTCAAGKWGACAGQVVPVAEICNGKDDNCNGKVDDNTPTSGKTCVVPGRQGACSKGITICQAGKVVCPQTVQPKTEICNKIDDDCDGKVDEDAAGTGSVCVVCGNGRREGNEECDDNNKKSLDGCSATCKWELGVKAKPALSCKAIVAAKQARGNKVYWLKPTGVTAAFEAYCDMTTDGGGWTHIFTISSVDGKNWTYKSPLWTNTLPFSTIGGRLSGDFKSPAFYSVLGTDFLIRDSVVATKFIGWKGLFSLSTFRTQLSQFRNYSTKAYNLKGTTIPLPWSASASLKGIQFSRTNWNSGGDCTYNMRITNGLGGTASTGLDGKGWGRSMVKTTLTVCGDDDIGYPASAASSNPVGVYYFYIR